MVMGMVASLQFVTSLQLSLQVLLRLFQVAPQVLPRLSQVSPQVLPSSNNNSMMISMRTHGINFLINFLFTRDGGFFYSPNTPLGGTRKG